jgi:hypothetical protein
MPPLIAFVAAVGGIAVVRWAYKTARRINQELEEVRSSILNEPQPQPATIPTLRRDPSTGTYRPG